MPVESVRLQVGEIKVGQALAWPVFDNAGLLLLRQGYVIKSQHQLDLLIDRGMFRQLTEEEKKQREMGAPPVEQVNPFDLIREQIRKLEPIFAGVESASPQVEARIMRMVRELTAICEEFPDATLGAVHLCHEGGYTLCHPIHQACLVMLIATRLQLEVGRRDALMAAALTANIGMRRLQEQLQQQAQPLTDQQREEIQQHPRRSVELLEKAGITNRLWLDVILQHHERNDGKGYPGGVVAESILHESRILAIADHYCAMVSARADRDPLTPSEQLRALFLDRGNGFDETVTLALIKELGVFPPGTCVRLTSGEIGIVVQRSDNVQPVVSAVISPRGGAYARPLRRDCSASEYNVRENVRWSGGAMNLSVLWGYA